MMRFDRFTERAQEAARGAYEVLQRYGHTQADTEHFLLALIEQPSGVVPELLKVLSADIETIGKRLDEELKRTSRTQIFGGGVGQIYITPGLKRVIEKANEEASKLKDDYVSTEHIFLAIAGERNTPSARILAEQGVTRDRILDAVREVRGGQKVSSPQAETRYRTLEKFSRDLTQLAREGKLDPVIGRDSEILRVIQVLSRRTKNNPVLIGGAGVGKTAIVEGLARKIAEDDIPEILAGKRVVQIDLGAMVAGTRFRGEFEERLKGAIEEIQRAEGEIILFIDEIHSVVGAGGAQGALDASSMMKPALARGELRCIGATTPDEYRRYIEKDSALERRFAPIWVEEPSIEDTISMLHGLRDRYEAHHNVRFTDEALTAAARLSARYVTDRRLPDKAVDLIDEAASKLRVAIYSMPPELKEMKARLTKLITEEEAAWASRDYERAAQCKTERMALEADFTARRDAWRLEAGIDETVDAEDIADVVHRWTGIPVSSLMQTEAERLLTMEEHLHRRIIGQEEAINAVADAIRRARSGLKDPHRPIGSFVFLGSSGVGKTELAKALADFLFDSDDAMVRIDMSEYREQHTVSRLFGAPPGYVGYEEGGQLTEAIRRRPYQIVLFDEIEKAHPDVWNALLQILEDGRLTDGQGRVVDFRNTVLIMTSNIGTQYARQGGTLGFRRASGEYEEAAESRREIEEGLRHTFRPEFLNRIDEIIIFHTLSLAHMEQIVDLQMADIRDQLSERGVTIELTVAARKWLSSEGYDPAFGARPLRRTLQRYVESPLSRRILRGEFMPGDHVVADVGATEGDEKGLVFLKMQPVALDLPTA
ncbi:MAG TPA: AAA family ATPase [Anaerolineae bacterium]|nr:AAA family ATPase [Anaerolineae bacterium]